MIKRAIILILILSGLYWITSSLKDGERTGIQKETKKTTKEIDTVDEVEKKNENKDSTKVINMDNKETSVKKEVKTVVGKVTPISTKTKNTVKTVKPVVLPITPVAKKVTAPIITKKVIKPIVTKKVTPTVPDRTTYIKVYMYEWGVDISSKEIPSGTVVFTVINSGRFSHDFTIGGLKDFGKVSPRKTVIFSTKIPTGSYEIFSGRRDDLDNGMSEGIVVVK